MKKKMALLENQIALQNANLNKISDNCTQKEQQLNNDITEYINQINELKNEMEVLNNIITNLTEEKENNSSELTNFQATKFTPKQSKALGYFYICSVIFVLLFSLFHESILKFFSRLSVYKFKFIHKK